MIKTLNLNRVYTSILENAYKISYEHEENQIWVSSFCLPLNDPKLEKAKQMEYVEITDENEYIGLYRIMPVDIVVNESNQEVTFNCVHVLSTLMDSVIDGLLQIDNNTTREVLLWVLSLQNNKDWVLGQCDFSRGFSYSWENENGLADAIFSIPTPFNEPYRFTWDTQSYPWTLNLVRPDNDPVCRVQEKYNLKGFTIERNPNAVVNKIIAKGQGEGVNMLTFASINGGKNYVQDNEAIVANNGRIISYIWVDRRFTDKESLLASTKALLEKWKKPIVTWTIDAIDLSKEANRKREGKRIKADEFKLGQVVRVSTERFGMLDLRILKITKSDLTGAPWETQLEIGDPKNTFGGTLADSERQQQINDQYANGATNILNYNYADNCDQTHPAILKFYIDDDVVNINTVELTFNTSRFRAYSRAIEGGGAVVGSTASGGSSTQTSSSGGNSTQTSSSGGSSSQTSSAAGQATQTSAAGGDHNHLVLTESSQQGPVVTKRYQGSAGGGIIEVQGSGGNIYTAGSSGSHSHSVTTPAHTHDVNIPAHTHSVSVPAHTHNVSIPAHTHDITLPNHTHQIDYGIFELSETASAVTIKIDGNTLPETNTSGERLNLVNYLNKTDEGKITKGSWHTLEITPNRRARIEAQLTLRVFIKSQLGGEF